MQFRERGLECRRRTTFSPRRRASSRIRHLQERATIFFFVIARCFFLRNKVYRHFSHTQFDQNHLFRHRICALLFARRCSGSVVIVIIHSSFLQCNFDYSAWAATSNHGPLSIKQYPTSHSVSHTVLVDGSQIYHRNKLGFGGTKPVNKSNATVLKTRFSSYQKAS